MTSKGTRNTEAEGTILRGWGKLLGAQIRVGLIGTVTAYDPTTRLATVQPVMKQPTGEVISPLRDVRIGQLRAGPFVISLPVADGDVVEVRFLDGTHDAFIADGEIGAVPDARRQHDYSDAVALPVALGPDSIAATSADHLVIGLADNSATLTLRDDGRIDVTSPDIRLGSSSAVDPVVLKGPLDTYLGLMNAAILAAAPGYVAPVPLPSGATKVSGE